MIQKVFVIVLFAVLILHPAGIPDVYANDIRVEGTRLIPAEEGSPAFIQFDISWDNSWRLPFSSGVNNWDAAWVFIKYREVGNTSAAWSHLYLSNTPGDYETGSWTGDGPGGAVIDPGLVDPRVDGSGNLVTPHSAAVNGNPAGRNPVVGAFVYRENVGRGRFEVSEMAFAFDLAENGMDTGKLYDFKVFAIEMVYVQQGSFFVGSGGNESGRLLAGGTTNTPFKVTNAWNGCIEDNTGCLWGIETTPHFFNSIGNTGSLAADYPTGYEGFYSMKYLVSQKQYVDFLNTLTRSQQQERFSSTTVGRFMHSGSNQTSPANRNGVRLMSDPGGTAARVFGNDLNNNGIAGEFDDGQWIPLNFIAIEDIRAYLDWAGLRPMTELEFEKASRGPLNPVPNEFSWGTNSIATNAYTLSNSGEAGESIANLILSYVTGNALYNGTRGTINGPVRVGAFYTENSSRVHAGSSFYGVAELTGNLIDRVVGVGGEAGRAFTGIHGNGILNANGTTDSPNWPAQIDPKDVFFRGGSWESAANLINVSSRVGSAFLYGRNQLTGFRGVRSAGCVNNAAAPTFDTSGGRSPNEASTGQLLTYKVTGTGSHLWIVPNDWQIVTGQGTNEITVLAGETLPATIRVAAVNSCGAGAEETINVNRTLEPYTLVLDDFFDATAQERYTVRLGISTTRDANLLFRTRPVPGEVDRQMRFDGFFFDTINPSGGSKPHGFETTGQPDGEFLATIRDVPAGHTIIIFDMIADDFPIGSSTFKFELEVFDIDRQEIIFQQVFEESYVDF